MPVPLALSSSPRSSETTTSKNDKNGKTSSDKRDTTGHFAEIYMGRLGELMNEFNDLEKTEGELLELLEEIRTQEASLLNALGDEIFVRIGISPPKGLDEGDSSARKPSPNEDLRKEQEEQDLQPMVPATSDPYPLPTAKGQPEDATESTVADVATAITATKRRSKRSRVATRNAGKQVDDPTIHNAQNLETNRHAQRREQRVLARRKLEEALFAEDDEDDDSSSTSS